MVTLRIQERMSERARRVEWPVGFLDSIRQLREVEKSFDEFIERETKRAREPRHAS